MAFGLTGVTEVEAYLAVVIFILAIALRTVTITFIFALAGKLFGPKSRCWLQDCNRYLASPLSWLILILWIYLVVYLLNLVRFQLTELILRFAIGVPVILGTFALRRVITNVVIRHNRWDKQSEEDFARILLVTEGISVITYILVLVEILLFYFGGFDFTNQVILLFLAVSEIILVLASYSSLKNFTAGFSLILTEPFRAGSLCRIGHFIGRIQTISLRATTLQQHDGSIICMPNAMFLDKFHQNLSARKLYSIELDFRVKKQATLAEIEDFMHRLHIVLQPFVASDEMIQSLVEDGHEAEIPPLDLPIDIRASNESIPETTEEDETRRSSSTERKSLRQLFRGFSTQISRGLQLDEDEAADRTNNRCSHDSTYHNNHLIQALNVILVALHHINVTCLVEIHQNDNVAKIQSDINLEILTIAQNMKIQLYH